MISTAELLAMQATVVSALDMPITIKRNTAGVSDGAGGATQPLTTIASVFGNLAQPSPQLMQNYDYLIGALSAWLVRMQVGTNVAEGDVLVTPGLTLRVQILLDPHSYKSAVALLATEIT